VQEKNNLAVTETSQITLDVKSLVGIIALLLTMAGIYFTLTAQITALQLDVIRMQDSVGINSEFRVLWPRGELGALPDDAVQDLNIEYLQTEMNKLQEEFDEHADAQR
jgi:hypothetical protein|tara:strand:+ start:169 stop:492 length:324 start_codon:yes stop_codon:yes gene_type:complete